MHRFQYYAIPISRQRREVVNVKPSNSMTNKPSLLKLYPPYLPCYYFQSYSFDFSRFLIPRLTYRLPTIEIDKRRFRKNCHLPYSVIFLVIINFNLSFLIFLIILYKLF